MERIPNSWIEYADCHSRIYSGAHSGNITSVSELNDTAGVKTVEVTFNGNLNPDASAHLVEAGDLEIGSSPTFLGWKCNTG